MSGSGLSRAPGSLYTRTILTTGGERPVPGVLFLVFVIVFLFFHDGSEFRF